MKFQIETMKKPALFASSAAIGCLIAAICAELFLALFEIEPPPSPRRIVCLTLDVSGSMSGDNLNDVKNAAKQFVSNRDFSRDSVALTIFSSEGTILNETTQNQAALLRKIDSVVAYGGTNFADALQKSTEAIATNDRGSLVEATDDVNKTVLLFTDGANSEGDPQVAIDLARRLRSNGVDLVAVATDDADFEFLNYLTGNPDHIVPVRGGNIQVAFQEAEKRIFSPQLMQSDSVSSPFLALFQVGVWTVILCLGIAFGIVGMQNYLLKKNLLSFEQAVKIAIGSVVAGLIAGSCGQFLYSFLAGEGAGAIVEASRIVGWGALGALMARVMVFFIPNLNARWAFLGGAFGGIFGAIGFIAASEISGEMGGRWIGALVLGAAIGLMVAVVEKVCREAWLTVVYSPRRFTQVNVGSVPISIGSGNDNTIRVADISEHAAEFKLDAGGVQCLEGSQSRRLQPGEHIRFGKIDVVVCSSEFPYQASAQLGDDSNSPPRPASPNSSKRPFAPSSNRPNFNRPNAPNSPASPEPSLNFNRPNAQNSPASPEPSLNFNRPNAQNPSARPESPSNFSRPNAQNPPARPEPSLNFNRPNAPNSPARPESPSNFNRPNAQNSPARPEPSQNFNRSNAQNPPARPESEPSDAPKSVRLPTRKKS